LAWDKAAQAPELRLAPGDEIEVKFRFWPELDDRQAIRPDGKITLQEVDDVQASGLTPMELDEHLTKLYEGKLKEPVISVVVRSLAAQRVYVGGEVAEPGEVPLVGRLTALEAIMVAGGFDRTTAKPSSVVIVRHVDGKRYAAKLDLSKGLDLDGKGEPFYLAPQDIVFVPATNIDKVNLWVDKYINQLIPSGLTYSHPVGNTGSIGYTSPAAIVR
jgi:polysaccharide export outer membrane protein